MGGKSKKSKTGRLNRLGRGRDRCRCRGDGDGGDGGDGGCKKKKRCKYIFPSGVKCKRKQIYELCYCHAIKEKKVKVDFSPYIVGTKGLIAFNGTDDNSTILFREGDTIGEYTGEMLSLRQFENRYPDQAMAKYAFKIDRYHYIDASKNRCLMAMINSSIGFTSLGIINVKSNARFVNDVKNKKCRIVASKNIYNLSEIILYYYISNLKIFI